MYYSLHLFATRAASPFSLVSCRQSGPSPLVHFHSHPLTPQSNYSPQLPPRSSSTTCLLARRTSERLAPLPVPVDSVAKEGEDALLPAGITQDRMPRHVAAIMDGNVRWARQRGLPGSAGHEAAIKNLWAVADICRKWDIKVFSAFAFSTQNWNRPRGEVDFLMDLFERETINELDNFVRKGIRVSVIGDLSRLPKSLAKAFAHVEETTKSIPAKLNFFIAFGYSGRYDILEACTSIAHKVKEGIIELDEINESLFERELKKDQIEFLDPDLMIRTSGELRISNFFLWQLAYTELYFPNCLWPDFDEDQFAAALRSYQQRDRRFGGRV